MLILIPIGQERAVRRLPVVTFCLIGIMILAGIYVESTAESQAKRYKKAQDDFRTLMIEYRVDYMARFKPAARDPTDPEYITQVDAFMRDIDRKVEESVRSGELYDTASDRYARYIRAREELDSARNRFIPFSLGFKSNDPRWYTWFTSLFLHAGILHLIGNLIFFWFSGIHIEDQWGRSVYLLIFFLGGIVAVLTHYLFHPLSDVPLVGASGAISALMGALLIRFPRLPTRIFWFALLLVIVRFGTFTIPAFVGIIAWVLMQILYLLINPDSHIAYWSHLGGFSFGAAAGLFFVLTGLDRRLNARQEALAENDAFDTEFEADPSYLKALDYESRGLTSAAIHFFNESLRKQPDNPDIDDHLAWLYITAGNITLAWKHLRKMLEHHLRAGNFEEVVNLLRRLETRALLGIIPDGPFKEICAVLETSEYPNIAKEISERRRGESGAATDRPGN